jgi:hypothetical protein
VNINDENLLEQKYRNAIRPLLSSWEQFKSAIYSELRLIRHDITVKIAIKNGTQITFKEEELPLFKTVASPTADQWSARLKEEREKLEYLKIHCHDQIIFKEVEMDPKNSRIFNCRSEFILNNQIIQVFFQIRLPLRYPYECPIAENFGFKAFIQPAGDYRNACLGKIKERWNTEGRMGVAHFLLMLSYYTALALFTKEIY